mmetsp:Transcript_89476/g.256257  ORF Transcript_89476/g.256257 Transcript_89476/m.256257 type:complete len:213 (-) Transcript_89476:83-721(-)
MACTSLARVASSGARSTLFIRTKEANAICSSTNLVSFVRDPAKHWRCLLTFAASTTATTSRSWSLRRRSSSKRKVCTTALGSARPLHSMIKPPISPCRAAIPNTSSRSRSHKSPRTLQHRQPSLTSRTCSGLPVACTTSFASRVVAPTSFWMTSKCFPFTPARTSRFTSVVFPLPRKPVRIHTGSGEAPAGKRDLYAPSSLFPRVRRKQMRP